MTWSAIPETAPVRMPGLLAFMERWAPGSTAPLVPATPDQIAALAEPHGGLEALPPVYREFLATMGASMGDLGLMWGTVAIGDLLEDQEDRERRRPDPHRFLKFGIGEENENGRQADDFFDLQRPTADRMDAAIVRIHEEDLLSGAMRPEAPFATFSDLLRRVFTTRLGLDLESKRQVLSFGFGPDLAMVERVYEFLQRLGFSVNELGASRSVVPLEAPERGAIAVLRAPTPTIPGTGLRVRARAETEHRILGELLTDYEKDVMGL